MNKSEKSIETMAEEIRGGDYTDFRKLLHICAYIPKETLDEASKQGYEKEDLYQEAVIAFLRALHSFDESRGAGFYTYASSCIKNHLLSLLRSGRRQKSAAMVDYVSIEEAEMIPDRDPETDWIEKEELYDTKMRIFSVLSDFEKDVLRYYLNGFSYKEIGEKLKKSEKSVGNALSRVRKKLRSEL